MGLAKMGTCSNCGNNRYIVNKKHGMCQICNHERLHGSKPKRKRISSLSTKQSERLVDYAKARSEYLAVHKFCEVRGCKNPATEIHHKKGRIGDLLTDKSYFLAVCRPCHVKIENNTAWAKTNGYSEDRNAK